MEKQKASGSKGMGCHYEQFHQRTQGGDSVAFTVLSQELASEFDLVRDIFPIHDWFHLA